MHGRAIFQGISITRLTRHDPEGPALKISPELLEPTFRDLYDLPTEMQSHIDSIRESQKEKDDWLTPLAMDHQDGLTKIFDQSIEMFQNTYQLKVEKYEKVREELKKCEAELFQLGFIELSRYSIEATRIQRFRFLVGLLEVPIPQTTGYEGEPILEVGSSISIGLGDGSKAFDPANGVFDDDANPSP